MEYNENELDNVIAGAHPEVCYEQAIANEHLFRTEKIEELKKMRGEITGEQQIKSGDGKLPAGELTEEELDKVQAGRTM